MDDSSRIDLTRRKALAAIGSIGVASAGAGLGTSAYFSDQETFENNQLTAGTLDMKVAATEYYSDWSSDEAAYAGMAATDSATDIRLPAGDGQPDARAIEIDIAGDNYANFIDALSTDADGDPYNRVNGGVSAATDGLCGTGSDADGPVIIDISDVKPGDFGGAQFAFELCTNPGYVWLTGGLDAASENTTTEPEGDDPDEESGVVELLDAIQVAYGVGPINGGSTAFEGTDSDGDGFEPVEQSTLREFLAMLDGEGVPLTGDIRAPLGGGTGDQGCFSGSPDQGTAVHQVSVVWWLPIDHGNQVQSDSVQFDLGFYTEQCRHNAGETDLVAYYPFENSADDLSGNGYDGSIQGDVSFTGGRIGRAASFDGSDDYVGVPPIELGSEFTVSAWTNLDQDSNWNDAFGAEKRFSVLSYDDGHIAVAIGDGGAWDIIGATSAGTTTPGTWQHWVVTYDGSTARLYVNGSEAATESGTTSVPQSRYHIGGRYQNRAKYRFDGAIDDVRIYSRALSASEVQTLYDLA
ncbi:MAG: LamG-like jellyroll fold domain-containing protein [Haloplanus sp.]